MKVDSLPGQWVWVEVGMPVRFYSSDEAPARVRHDRIVRIDRIELATSTTPALAIWSDAEGSYGVDVDLVKDKVMSLPPSANAPILAAADAVARALKRSKNS